MERSTHGRTTRAGLAGALVAGLVLTSCGLTGPNTSSTKQTTATTRKSGTSFPTVAYVPTTTSTTTTLASVTQQGGGAAAGGGATGGGGNVDPTPETPGAYTVQAGDVAVLIARRYSITLSELAAANPNIQLDRIQPGDKLVIPPPSQGGTQTPPIAPPSATTTVAGRTTTTTVAAAKTGATYTVQSGDTLVGIAKKIGISLATLQQLNPGVGTNLQVGQKLNIPKGASAGTTATTKKP